MSEKEEIPKTRVKAGDLKEFTAKDLGKAYQDGYETGFWQGILKEREIKNKLDEKGPEVG